MGEPQLVWYFDFVSPYSYLQFEAYPELVRTAVLRPVLFAGPLNHWGGKGPALVERLGLTLAATDAMIAGQRVKDALAANGRQAIDRGVYGVPTFDALRERTDASGVKSGELFWGLDATGMLLDYLEDASVFDEPKMRHIANLPVGAARNS